MDADDPYLKASTPAGDGGLKPLLELLLDRVPAPEHDPNHPLQALVTNLDASPYVGRLALCRVRHGTLKRGEPAALVTVGTIFMLGFVILTLPTGLFFGWLGKRMAVAR